MNVAPRSRNDPCPCGSGARYKHCHGAPQPQSPARATSAEAHFHDGNRLRDTGDWPGAIAQYEAALALDAGHPAVLNNLGLTLESSGDRRRAESCYREALARDPDYLDALGNLAGLVFEREDHRDAALLYDRLLRLRPSLPPPIWVRHAIAQQRIGAWDKAEASFREAASRDAGDPRVHANLGTLLIERGRFADAEPVLRRALELQPNHGYALSMLALSRLQRCAWDELQPLFAQLEQLLASDADAGSTSVNPFTLLAMPLSPLAQRNAARRWANGIASVGAAPRPPCSQRAGERLRVGFVSSDWREHAVGRMIVQLLETVDRGRFETFGYALLPPAQSAFGDRITRAVEHLVDVSADPTTTIAQRIRDDRIALLIDLNGYTTHERAALFAQRPTPVQMHWLGYLGTLGAPWVDYILTDRFATPTAAEPDFSERFLYLDDCLFPSDTQREVATPPPTREDCGLPPDAFVFCCFNNHYKILPHIFDVWMRLLREATASVLWLSPANEEAMGNLKREAARRSVNPARLVFAPRVAPALHLARQCHADLFLDTLPYNAGVTANDALWMGVPVLTCSGATMASRVAGSQLHAIGLPELVTSDLAEYEAVALRLAQQPDELGGLRARLAQNRRTHALFDTPRFARAFEYALLRAASGAAQESDG